MFFWLCQIWIGHLSKLSKCFAGPSPVVAYHLCGPGKESGEALLKRFKDIRRTLEQGKNFRQPYFQAEKYCSSCCDLAFSVHLCTAQFLPVMQAYTTWAACERRARLHSTSCGTCTHCSWRCVVRFVITLFLRRSCPQKNGVSSLNLCCACCITNERFYACTCTHSWQQRL